jgi:hypothetical protein
MATALVSLSISADTTLASAVTGKIIRLKRLLGSSQLNAVLKSGSTPISTELRSGSNANVDISWTESPLACARGEALVAHSYSISETEVWIEYDVVD